MNYNAIIHIAKKQCNISDESYRDILSGFTGMNGQPATSLSDCSETTKASIYKVFVEKLGFIPAKTGAGRNKYNTLANRTNSNGKKLASPKQLRMIEAMWVTSPVVRVKTVEALRAFQATITGVDKLEWLLSSQINKIVLGIRNLKPGKH